MEYWARWDHKALWHKSLWHMHEFWVLAKGSFLHSFLVGCKENVRKSILVKRKVDSSIVFNWFQSHHRPRESPFELNDIFAITNAASAIALLSFDSSTKAYFLVSVMEL
ncbi:beta-carotene 3-hydroxylase [Sarracenia purpurea var. burkii]